MAAQAGAGGAGRERITGDGADRASETPVVPA
jgi:hypothetical protein